MVLVTGGAGFIGSHACEALLARGMGVRILDDFSSGTRGNLARIADAVEVLEGSVESQETVARAMRGCTAVVHLAARTSVAESMENPALYARVNAGGTRIVCEAARGAGVRRVVFAASSSAYGDHPAPQDESMAPRPLSPYAESKIAGEHALAALAADGACDAVPLRFFNVYGERQEPTNPYAGVIARFMARMARGEGVTIFGDGMQTRDFVYAGDAADAIVRAISGSRRIGGRPVNIGTGHGTSIIGLASTVAEVQGIEARFEFAPAREGEVRDSIARTALASELLGFTASHSLGAGLRAMMRADGRSG
jgi:UDP-glucose 4-epimerase